MRVASATEMFPMSSSQGGQGEGESEKCHDEHDASCREQGE